MVVKDTKMSIANNTDDAWGDDVDVLEMEVEYQAAKNVEREKKQKEGSQKKGRLWIFKLPPYDATGTSTASGRILTPTLKDNVHVLVHDIPNTGSNKVWKRVPCKKFLGFDCEYCDPICEKYHITWEELSDPDKMTYLDKYARKDEWGYKTAWFYVWYFWHNEGYNDQGTVRLFAYARNQASPIDDLLTMNKKRTKDAAAKGKREYQISDYDISLTQKGEGWDRTIRAYAEDPDPFQHWDRAKELVGHTMGKKHLLYDYFIAMEFDNDEIKKLRKLAAEWLGDDSYLVTENNEENGNKQSQPVRKATTLPPPDLTDDDDEVDIEDFEGE